MPDLTKAKRLDELKSRFQEGARFTVGKMVREFGITRRTANRDLLDLQDLGLDLGHEDLPDGQRQWFAGAGSRNVKVTYSIRDVMSLFLGRRMFDFLENTILEESLNRVCATGKIGDNGFLAFLGWLAQFAHGERRSSTSPSGSP
jgi:predicted DNA-binding transcriptional regulator YafY